MRASTQNTPKENLRLSHFDLKDGLNKEHLSFYDENGFILFKNFISKETVALLIKEIKAIEKNWLDNNVEKVNGVPLRFGKDADGKKIIQRMCFLSMYSNVLHEFLQDSRLASLSQFLSPYEGRIAENEKDGLIMNHFIHTPDSGFTKMGWHTDSPRIFFMGIKLCP